MACIIVQNKLDSKLFKLIENSKDTIFINDRFENPTYEYIENVQKSTKYGFEHNINRIYRLLYTAMPKLGANTLKDLAQLINDNLPSNCNNTILKNYYMQLQKWFSTELYLSIQRIDHNLVSNIIFNIQPSKIELLSLYIMYKLGCNVYIISEFTDKMKEYDNLQLKKIDDTTVDKVNTNNKSLNDVYAELINKETITDSVILGYDNKTELNNFIYNIVEYINNDNGVVIDQELTNQDYTGINIDKLRTLNKVDFVIAILKDLDWEINIKDIFTNYINETFNYDLSTKDINLILKLIIWTNVYIILNLHKLILFYGCKKEKYTSFINLCRKMPLSTIYILTDKDDLPKGITPTIEFSNSTKVYPIPKFEEVSKKSTLAYEATKRMTKEVFNGNTLGLYRDFQYSTCMVNTLTSTFDELFMLWDVENMVRPHFASSENKLKISTFFTQVLGYNAEYKKQLSNLFKSADIIVDNYLWGLKHDKFENEITENMLGCRELIVDNKLNYDAIKYCLVNPFKDLNSDLEMHMISKIDELIQLDCISDSLHRDSKLTISGRIVQAILNLDYEYINLAQSYDFTKDAPKIVVLHETKGSIYSQLAIQLAYLHLVGFDVIILIPTKYKGIELYVDDRLFQTITIGDVVYDNIYSRIAKKSKLNGVAKLFSNILD